MKYYLMSFILLFISCKEEGIPINQDQLSGKWYITKAFRKDKETNSLQSGYFDFDVKNKMVESNVFPIPGSKPYETQGSKLIVKDEPTLELIQQSFADSLIVLTGKVGIFEMQFYLSRTPGKVLAPEAID